MFVAFRIISSVLSLYSLLCFIRIILTWIPQVSYSKPAQILAKICDPWLNIFRGIKWLKVGAFDFSPALALCLLSAVAEIFKSLSYRGTFSVGVFLAVIIQIILSIASSLITFLIILFLIRYIIIVRSKSIYSGNPMVDQIDRSIAPIVYKLAKTVTFGKTPEYKKSLLLSIIVLVIILAVLGLAAGIIIKLFQGLPF